MSVNRRKAPILMVEISAGVMGRFFSPRVRPFGFFRSSVGGPMPLRLGRQFLSRPARERAGFRVAHEYGPREWQRHRPEHSSIFPKGVRIAGGRTRARQPEVGMFQPSLALPRPILGPPKLRIVVAASMNEFEVLAV